MGDPFTREICDICKKEFEIPMQRGRRVGWYRNDATLTLIYYEDEKITVDNACSECAEAIEQAVKKVYDARKR